MIINNKFEIGQIIYLKTDKDQQERIITGVKVGASSSLAYEVYAGIVASWHYDFEMTAEKDVLKYVG